MYGYFRMVCSSSEKSFMSGDLPEIHSLEQIDEILMLATKKGLCLMDSSLNIVKWENHTERYKGKCFHHAT